MIRLSFPIRGWAKFSWHETSPPDVLTARSIQHLAAIPGVRCELTALQVPKTAWNLEAFLLFLDCADLTETWVERMPIDEMRPAWPPLSGLYPWQSEAVGKAWGAGGLLLCDEPGLGKTRVAILAVMGYRYQCDRDQRRVSPCVIVAPGFTLDVWRSELLAVGAITSEDELAVLRSRDLNDPSWKPEAEWIFVHYDVVHAWSSRIAAAHPLAAIVDEAHWIKNGQTKRATGTATAVGRAGFRVMLTGTPMDNHVGELWHPLSVLTGRWTWGSPLDFRKRYAGAASNGFGYEDRGPRHIEELRRRMEPWYLRRTAADLPAGSLPPLQRVRISSPLGAAARRAHDALLSGHDLETLLTAVLEGRAGEDTLALLGRLRAVCSDAKVNATRDYVANLIGQGQSVVVFSWRRKTAQDFVGGFLDDVRSPTVTCPDFAAAIHGAHNQAQRDAVVREFRYAAGRGSALLSATFGVLKEGVTLTPARHVVLHDLDWLFSPLLQAEKRVHRLTQGGGCVSAWSVAEDSFDQVLARLLLRKADWLDRTLGIKAPRESVEELELSGLIPNDTAMADWARAQLKRWV